MCGVLSHYQITHKKVAKVAKMSQKLIYETYMHVLKFSKSVIMMYILLTCEGNTIADTGLKTFQQHICHLIHGIISFI